MRARQGTRLIDTPKHETFCLEAERDVIEILRQREKKVCVIETRWTIEGHVSSGVKINQYTLQYVMTGHRQSMHCLSFIVLLSVNG
jgi:hypothetical protein